MITSVTFQNDRTDATYEVSRRETWIDPTIQLVDLPGGKVGCPEIARTKDELLKYKKGGEVKDYEIRIARYTFAGRMPVILGAITQLADRIKEDPPRVRQLLSKPIYFDPNSSMYSMSMVTCEELSRDGKRCLTISFYETGTAVTIQRPEGGESIVEGAAVLFAPFDSALSTCGYEY